MKFRWTILTLILIGSASSQEPVKPSRTPTIITATRQVTLFTGLERQMLQAVQKKDGKTLKAMLTEDCSIALPKADSLSCDDWMDSVVSSDFTLKSFAIRSMSVTDLGEAALVNYERDQQAVYKGKDHNGDFFVLDLWKKSGNSWKLVNRYVSRIESPPVSTPTPG